MLLSSSAYFIFLAGVFLLYWPASRSRALSLAVILFGNYFFYAKWDLFYLFLIPLASSCDFAIGLGLARYQHVHLRRALVAASVLLNVGLLAALKYMPFLLDNFSALTNEPKPEWHWSFPLGISFYCFQSLTYTLDLYRRDAKATDSYLAHLAAVSFFPTTLAGPITRVSSLLAQFEKKPALSGEDGGRAVYLIGIGLTKKLLIADYLGVNLVNRVFDFPNLYTAAEVLIAVYAYAFQLYFDFSGYTDIAIGSALLLGLRLPVNFKTPYMAENIPDFWRRWHITLSNWLRDYLYFSLPGLRSRFKVFTYLNLVITMVIGGLWHGPSWTYVVWGLLHGGALAGTRAWQVWRGNRKPNPALWARGLRLLGTFHFVCFAWIFFRAGSMEGAFAVLARIASGTIAFANISAPILIILGIGAAAHYLPEKWENWCSSGFARTPFYVQAAAMALLLLAIHYVAATGAAPFIYTRF
ncbi:MAG: MBOAT family O-acyltransferase [Bryobacteraceae bacterium]|nr:MBOAT family O-acyltransferase [Bryobacteraceae bacterium]